MTFVQPEGKRLRRTACVKAAAVAIAVVSVVVWIASACSSGTIDVCDANNWEGGVKNNGWYETCCEPAAYPGGVVGEPTCPNYGTDAGTDAGDGGDAMADGPIEPPCPGQCVPWLPDPWESPQLVWIGPQPDAPPCPATASLMVYAGSIDLDAGDLPCGQCGCDPPDGGCILPTTLTANSTPCPATDPSTVQTPFDAPPGWDGGCFAGAGIDAGALCDGVPCVVSLTIAPPTVADPPCAPIQPPTPDAGLSMSYAVACIGQAAGTCAGGFFCAPSSVTGWHMCIAQEGDAGCVGSTYTEKHLAFSDPVDMRTCSPCTCGAPSDSKCTVAISTYPNAGCVPDETYGYAWTVNSTMPEWCEPVIAGTALLSKSASPPVYVPGTCTPDGGVPGGTVTLTSPTTFCCIPQP
jgi:hypothetical protein